jgi:hypothetical protein
MLGSYGVRERYMEARRACSGQPPPACCAICNGNFQLALSRLLKPGGFGGFSSLMTLTLSAAHRASLRRIVENAGSSAYAKSSAFSSGFFGPHPENNTSTCYRAGQFGLAQDTEARLWDLARAS